jgi:hypothetical protein
LWCGLALAAAAGFAWEAFPLQDAGARLDALPASGVAFASRDVPPGDAERRVYGEARVVKRVYAAGRMSFAVTLVDGTRNRHAVHDPLYCFRGAGWALAGERRVPLPGGEGRLVQLARKGEMAEALVWFTDGRRRHASPLRYWAGTTLRRLTLGASGEEPVLAVVQPLGAATLDPRALFDRVPSLADL